MIGTNSDLAIAVVVVVIGIRSGEACAARPGFASRRLEGEAVGRRTGAGRPGLLAVVRRAGARGLAADDGLYQVDASRLAAEAGGPGAGVGVGGAEPGRTLGEVGGGWAGAADGRGDGLDLARAAA